MVFLPDVLRFGDLSEAHRGFFIHVKDGAVAGLGMGFPGNAEGDCEIVRGGAVIPPLADAHVHLFLGGSWDREERDRISRLDDGEAIERALNLLEEYRNAGIAAVRDGGDPRGIALKAAAIANTRPERYARVTPAGEPVFRKGRYGGFLGKGVAGVGEAVDLIKKNRDGGAVLVKILATGINSLEKAGLTGEPQFRPDELAEITAMARKLGMGVMVHANGPAGDVIALGPDSLEHGFWMEDGDVTALAGGKISWVPTVGAWACLSSHPGLDERAKEVVGETHARQTFNVGKAHAQGVRIAAGSDAGTPGVGHVSGLAGEIARLAGAGMTAREALNASAREAMKLCGADPGGLNPGGRAGFAVFESDPLDDLSALSRPVGVFIGGVYTPARAGAACEKR